MDIDWKSVGATAGKFAPMLGALLGGPAGASVGAMIASALGTGNTPMEVQQALVDQEVQEDRAAVEAAVDLVDTLTVKVLLLIQVLRVVVVLVFLVAVLVLHLDQEIKPVLEQPMLVELVALRHKEHPDLVVAEAT